MSTKQVRVARPVAAAATALLLCAGSAGAHGGLAFGPNVRVSHQQPGGWDEPAGLAASDGSLWVAAQNPKAKNTRPDMSLFDSSRDGSSWVKDSAYYQYLAGRTEGQLGDVTLAADRAGTVFVGHLTSTLQTNIDWTRDHGKTWHTAADVASLPNAGSTTSPFLVDRPWITVYSPDSNYKHDIVYLEYHDFVTSDVFVVTCRMATGSLQCGNETPVANSQTACNSLPSGIAVAPKGAKHPGRVYAVWETADSLTNVLSGCNYTQLAPFYALYVAWSDSPTSMSSWHDVPVYIGPTGSGQNCPGTSIVAGASTNTCADASELFTPTAVDQAGNVYVGFIDYISTLHKHYDVYLARSSDGGNTWDGKKNGSGPPVLVSNDGGTHYIPGITAGSPGRVALAYYTATNYSTKPYQAGASCPVGAPPLTSCQGKNQPEPPKTTWVLDVSESTNAVAAHPRFTQVQASSRGVVVHYGDMCNLGIYCDGSSTGNRSLFENNAIFPDRTGRIVVAWGDQRLDPHAKSQAASSSAQSQQEAYDEIYSTRQASGPLLFVSHAHRTHKKHRTHAGHKHGAHKQHHPSHKAKKKRRGFTG